MGNNNIDVLEQVIKDKFEGFYLSEKEMDSLRTVLLFHAYNQSKFPGTHMNLLLISEDEDRSNDFIERLVSALGILIDNNNLGIKIPESELIKNPSLIQKHSGSKQVFVIDKCISEVPANWNVLMKAYEYNPKDFKIICANKDVEEIRFKAYEHIYYRVFNKRIYLRNYSAEDAREAILKLLNDNKYISAISDDFKVAIKDYINTVYPKADLKKDAFVKDLFNRIVSIASEEYVDESGITLIAKHVPFYKKSVNENEIETKTESFDVVKPRNVISTNDDVTNVLLLSLSTAEGLRPSKYSYNGKFFDGNYQLDPVPRILSDKLASENQTLDKIVILYTDQTVEPTIPSDTGKVSPMDYFTENTVEWMRKYEVEDKESLYAKLYRKVRIDSENIKVGLREAIDYLRGIRNLNLYIDMHGGPREDAVKILALVSLLRTEGIVPKSYFSIPYNQNEKIHPVEEKDEFEIFDFVSGMNEFLNYGRITTLERYIGKEAPDFFKSICTISRGIQFCHVPEFESGLSSLSKELSNMKTETFDKIGYLSLFVENIKKDYGILLDENHSVMDEVRWCNKKGFYQQAVTLIEARMPDEIVKSLLIIPDDLNALSAEAKGHFNENVWIVNRLDRSLFGTGQGDKEQFQKDKEEYQLKIINWIANKDYGWDYREGVYQKKCNYVKFYNSWNESEGEELLSRSYNKFDLEPKEGPKGKYYCFVEPLSFGNGVRKDNGIRFLKIHSSFKTLRHFLNHAGEEELSLATELIPVAIEEYLDFFEKTVSSTNSVSNNSSHYKEKVSRDKQKQKNTYVENESSEILSSSPFADFFNSQGDKN